MTGSFLFVKPSDPAGKPGTEYSGESPRYPYDRASWEWLLERALRRALIPWALTKSHSRILLSGHEDQYSMHRWGSYDNYRLAGRTPNDYQSVGGPGSQLRKTDADLSIDDRDTPLPESWDSKTEVPTYSRGTKVAYGINGLEETVASLPFSLEWLHPGWSSSAIDAWDLTAFTVETTNGEAKESLEGPNWTWKTTVDHVPYKIPNDPPFKCLSHMRTDDPTVTVNITNDDNEPIGIEVAPTPMSAPRTPEGSVRNFHGTQVRSARDGAAYEAGWALYEFSIPYRYGLDYSESKDSNAYGRDGKTSESVTNDEPTIGCLVDIPDKDSGNIVVSENMNAEWARFVHEVDWGGKQTWWHTNDFPKGLDSVLSPKLKDQLKALCPECQPAIPPSIPAFHERFPDNRRLPWDYSYSTSPYMLNEMYPQDWMRHFALACTPLDMSARLDAMTTTVHRVPSLFAKIRTVTTTYETADQTVTERNGSKVQYRSYKRYKATANGTSLYPIPADNHPVDHYHAESGKARGVSTYSYSYSNPEGGYKISTKTVHTYEKSFESNAEFLVCLRSTTNTTASMKVTEKFSEMYEDPYAPGDSEREISSGSLPDSYDPDPDDLLFPNWVLPWVEAAELFASIESRTGRKAEHGTKRTETYNEYHPAKGESTYLHYGSGSGTRTHKARRKIISLGQMDMTTGRFPAIDVAAILSDVDPDSGVTSEFTYSGIYNSTVTEKEGSDGNRTVKTDLVVEDYPEVSRVRYVSYYVVVRWKFDRKAPETLKTDSPLVDLYRKLADAKKALSDKRRELSDAEAALETAISDRQAAEDALARAKENLADPEGATPAIIEEANAAIERAKQELSDAKSEKSNAQSEYDVAVKDLQRAENDLKSAKEAYDAAVGAGEGVEGAQAALEFAYALYYDAVNTYADAYDKLATAEANEAAAHLTADNAQDYYDTLLDRIDELFQKSVDDAQEEVDDATSRIEEWTRKIEEAEDAIPGLEDDVEAAEQAIREAGGNVP